MLAPWEGDRIHEIGVDDLELTLGSVKGQACLITSRVRGKEVFQLWAYFLSLLELMMVHFPKTSSTL